MKIRTLILSALFLGCTTVSKVKPNFINTPDERAFQELALKNQAGQYIEAVAAADEFQKEFPYSLNLQKARFQKAQALEGLNRWNEAAETYLAISNFSKKSQPEIAAMSVYRLSYVYEALGDNQRVLTSLFDAQRLEQYLPPEIGMAEIPARLAMAYMKEGNADEAQQWLNEADRGLKQILESQREPITNQWLARTYFNMGSVSTHQLTSENALSVIKGQQAIQRYLLKSLQYNDVVWSAKAANKIKDTYSAIYAVIEKPTYSEDPDQIVSAKAKRDEQARIAGPFDDLIDQALSQEPNSSQVSNAYQADVFGYLKELKSKLDRLVQDPVYTPLIRRSDKVSPKKETPATILKSEDPN